MPTYMLELQKYPTGTSEDSNETTYACGFYGAREIVRPKIFQCYGRGAHGFLMKNLKPIWLDERQISDTILFWEVSILFRSQNCAPIDMLSIRICD